MVASAASVACKRDHAAAVRTWAACCAGVAGAVGATLRMTKGRVAKRGRVTTGQRSGAEIPLGAVVVAAALQNAARVSGEDAAIAAVDGALGEAAPSASAGVAQLAAAMGGMIGGKVCGGGGGGGAGNAGALVAA